MNRSFHVRFLIVLLIAIAIPAFAQTTPPRTARYVVTLDAAAAIGRTEIIGAELAATYGGTLEETRSATGDVVIVRIPRSRAGELAADPRVKSVASPGNHIAAPNVVTEPVNWTGGVSYTYDGAGNVTKIGDDDFLYDDVGRLVQAKINGATRTYEYDAFGNRRKCAHNVTTDCQFGYSVTSLDNHTTNVSYDPDNTGNVTRMGGHTYEYDTAQMMTSDDSGAGISEYVYTADDERIATHSTNGGRWEWTVRDIGGKVLREFASEDGTTLGSASWKWTKDFVYRETLLLASIQPETDGTISRYHYHVDHLGTPRRITNDDDDIVGVHDYYAFGPEVSGGLLEQSPTKLKYTKHEREDGSEPYMLDYMHARFSNPTLGRFLSVDPVLDIQAAVNSPQTWNRYAYVANNPMNRVDPDGREIRFYEGDISAQKAFENFQQLFPAAARQYISMDKDGYARLDASIGRQEFGDRYGAVAGRLGTMIRQLGWTATVEVSDSWFAAAGGGAQTQTSGDTTRIEINPHIFEKRSTAFIGGVLQTVTSAMAHELLGHAYAYSLEIDIEKPHRYGWMNKGPKQENYAIWAENQWRADFGLPLRTFYTQKSDYVPPDQ